jgi:hypothetical protein
VIVIAGAEASAASDWNEEREETKDTEVHAQAPKVVLDGVGPDPLVSTVPSREPRGIGLTFVGTGILFVTLGALQRQKYLEWRKGVVCTGARRTLGWHAEF